MLMTPPCWQRRNKNPTKEGQKVKADKRTRA